jgi:hypothetical protein
MASDDPDFESKAAAMIALYLKPPTSIGIPPPKGVPLSRTLGNRRASPIAFAIPLGVAFDNHQR